MVLGKLARLVQDLAPELAGAVVHGMHRHAVRNDERDVLQAALVA